MEKEKKIRLIYISIVLVVIIACGIIGYLNRSGSNPGGQANAATTTPNGISELKYCTESAGICAISFGMDNAGNMLIILKNDSPSAEIYAKIDQTGTANIYPCSKIEFGIDTYYCLGNPVPDQSDAVVKVFAKGSDLLLASGVLAVRFDATPVVVASRTPQSTVTTQPTLDILASPTPAYPNSTAYPNPTPYP